MGQEYENINNTEERYRVSINEFFIECLNSTFNNYVKNLILCKEEFSEEVVHDFRVSIRRFNSLLKLIADVYRIDNISKTRKVLKGQLALFGKLRDTQVEILNLEKYRKASVLEQFLRELKLREEFYILEIKEQIENFGEAEIRRQIEKLKSEISEYKSSMNLMIEILRMVRQSFEEVIRLKNKVSPDSSDSIHKLRLAFKRFRYMVEHIQPLTDISQKKIGDFRLYQTMMGMIQDNSVLVAELERYNEIGGGAQSLELNEIIDEIKREGIELIEEFISKIDMIYTFWDFSFKN